MNPVLTVVRVVGGGDCRVMIDTEPLKLAVQRLAPSKAMPTGLSPKLPAAVVMKPGGCVGSITYRLPGAVRPGTKTRPNATTTPWLAVAPVQVPRILPLLPCTCTTWP